ncbi:MAG TPA: HAMP domain-containing sensor histidine kinase, partial [Caldimonas sp.]|nr:HAMP domain-containing sensor histidine kinase [Caldimonas sp.]
VDHLPAWLDGLARALGAAPGGAEAVQAADRETRNAEAHGLQRWQQGYDLHEVTREWAALHRCLVDEIESYLATRSPPSRRLAAQAHATLAFFIGEATSESACQYFRLDRLEAAGALHDLEKALADVQETDRRRGELWQQAAHDLRGNLGVVANVAHGLSINDLPVQRRDDFVGLLRHNVKALHGLLDDVTELARLQAGQETRRVASFDAGELLQRLGDDVRPLAGERNLSLDVRGPRPLAVEGDAVKVRRIAQNLVLNALKYTSQGGVELTWGEGDVADGRWWFEVRDSGPGFHAGPGAPLVSALGAVPGEAPAAADARPVNQAQGEGLGLAIVKRLCELLGAQVELTTATGRGTVVRVLVPRNYAGSSN